LKSIIFFLFFCVTISAQNKPVGNFEHRYFTDNSYDGFCFGQIFTLQLNQDNTYILIEDIEDDNISEPNKIVGLYTYNENILTLQTPTIQTFKVNKKMTKLKSVKKVEAFGKKIWKIYIKKIS
jgi:hypothetical protein